MGESSDETKDLYKLLGNYERFTQEVDNKLGRIEERLETGSETFVEIQQRCAQRTNRINSLEKDVGEMKGSRLNLKTKIAIALPLTDVIIKYSSEIWAGIMKVMNGG